MVSAIVEAVGRFLPGDFTRNGDRHVYYRDPVLMVVEVQESDSKDRFYLNLGIHYSFLPGFSIDLREPNCAFRFRLERADASTSAWRHDEPDLLTRLEKEIERQWKGKIGELRKFPGQFTKLSFSSFDSIGDDVFPPVLTRTMRMCVAGYICAVMGDLDSAKQFAEAGLQKSTGKPGLGRQFQDLIKFIGQHAV